MDTIIQCSMDQRCRICLQIEKESISLYQTVDIEELEELTISKILFDCAYIQAFEDDNKPQSVCGVCSEKAKEAYKFKLSCEKSNKILQDEIIDKLFKSSVMNENICDVNNFLENSIGHDVYSNNNNDEANVRQNYLLDNLNGEESDIESSEVSESPPNIATSLEGLENRDSLDSNTPLQDLKLFMDTQCLQLEYTSEPNEDIQTKVEVTDVTVNLNNVTNEEMGNETNSSDRIENLVKLGDTKPSNVLLKRKQQVKNLIYSGLKPEAERTCLECGVVCRSIKLMKEHEKKAHPSRLVSATMENKDFRCSYCGSQFKLKKALLMHFFIKHESNTCNIEPEEKRTCRRCGLLFNSIRNANIHVNRKHVLVLSPKEQRTCNECGHTFQFRSNMLRHKMLHHGSRAPPPVIDARRTCNECGEIFNTRKLMLSHKSQKHNSEAESERTCNICETIYKSKITLMAHMNNKHKVNVDMFPEEQRTCIKCNKIFKTRRLMIDHRRRIHTKRNDMTFEQKQNEPESERTCLVCNEVFATSLLMRLHKDKHIKCYYCPFINTCGKAVAAHMRTEHPDEKYLSCKLCGKNFYSKEGIQNHMRTHTDKRFTCEVCGLTLKNNVNLRYHQYIHTGEKPLICDICGKGFHQPTSLKYHTASHINEKNHVCHLCGVGFQINLQLRKHIRTVHEIQRIYQCDMCDKSFKTRYHLKLHSHTHTGLKEHQCDVCFKLFGTKKHLRVHKYIHDDVKPYKCDRCDKTFAQTTSLRWHINHHK